MPESVWLSNLTFAGLRPSVPVSNSEGKNPTPHQPPETQGARLAPDPNPNRTRIHDRLAADKPGEELSPDASIWKLYLEEAKFQDNELAEGQNKNVDTLLLFAALFSAILTAFLIESKDLLQSDNADITASLLLLLVQSQQRLELGLAPSITTPTDIPSFTPSVPARCVNGLWFAALAFSLAAVMIAILAKEWLAEFTASKLRAPREYALLRQARYDNFVQWRALHIIDLLPTLLHISLLLFSVGLVVYLWTFDAGIAIFVAIITSVTTSFYLVTTLLGAFCAPCPFVTQVSKYTQRLAQAYFKRLAIIQGHSGGGLPDPEATTIEDIRALRWLAGHARDPNIGDCAYQALAGLKDKKSHPSASTILEVSTILDANKLATVDDDQRTLLELYTASELDYQTELVTVFYDLCQRLSDAPTENARELAVCQGTNIARYAAAISKLVPHADHSQTDSAVPRGGNNRRNSVERQKRPLAAAFDSLDCIWDSYCPPFSPDAYASLTATEIRLTLIAVLLDGYVTTSASPRHSGATADREGQPHHPTIETIPLTKLRARYSRTLARAAFLLFYHNNGRAPISLYPILGLLETIRTASRTECLNPDSHLSIHQGEDPDSYPEYYVHIVGVGSSRYLGSDCFGDWDGILAQLLELVSSSGSQGMPKVEHAASRALSALAPVLLKQWMKSGAVSTGDGPKRQEICMKTVIGWPAKPQNNGQHESVNWALSQLLALSVVAVSQADHTAAAALPTIALKALCERAESYSKFRVKDNDESLASSDTALIHQLISLVASDSLEWSVTMATRIYLLRFLVVQNKQKISFLFYSKLSSAEELQALLRIIKRVPEAPEGKLLLESFFSQAKEMSKDDKLLYFIEGAGVLSDLVLVGRYMPEYTSVVTDLLRHVIHTVQSDLMLDSDNISDFLDAVSFILQPSPEPAEQPTPERSFVLEVFDVLKRGYELSSNLVCGEHFAFEALEIALKNGTSEGANANMLTELHKMRYRHATDLPGLGESLAMLFA